VIVVYSDGVHSDGSVFLVRLVIMVYMEMNLSYKQHMGKQGTY